MNENEFDQANQKHWGGNPAPLTRSHHSTIPSLHYSTTPEVTLTREQAMLLSDDPRIWKTVYRY